MNSDKIYEFEHANFWSSTGILYCEFKRADANCTLTADKVELIIHTIQKLTNNKPMPFLIILGDSVGNFTSEAANLIATNPYLKKVKVCEAYLVNTINGKLLVNSYKRIYEPTTPYYIFNNLKEATRYCLESKIDFNANATN